MKQVCQNRKDKTMVKVCGWRWGPGECVPSGLPIVAKLFGVLNKDTTFLTKYSNLRGQNDFGKSLEVNYFYTK